MIRMSKESLRQKKDLYFNDPLFRELLPSLCKLERDCDEMKPEEVWCETDKAIDKLKRSPFPDYEIDSLYNECREDYMSFTVDKKHVSKRTEIEAIASADTVMTVLLLRLADAAPTKASECPHGEICRHISIIIRNSKSANELLESLRREEDHQEKVCGYVLPVTDYMVEDSGGEDLLAVEEQNMVKTKAKEIVKMTSSLLPKMVLSEDQYALLWTRILSEDGAVTELSRNEPRTQQWGNIKLVAGVLCMLQNAFVDPRNKTGRKMLDANAYEIARALGSEKYRAYVNLDYLSSERKNRIRTFLTEI